MPTTTDEQLIANATARKKADETYIPTLPELKAIDRRLIGQALAARFAESMATEDTRQARFDNSQTIKGV